VPAPALTAGSLIAGRYRLERELGRGGMGVVWAATHTVTERAVALKFLHGPSHLRPRLRERFLREARAASAVRHPNVVDVLDVFEFDDDTPLMVMERLYGETLGQRLARLKAAANAAASAALEVTAPEGVLVTALPVPRRAALSLPATAALFVPIVSALSAAHARGVVHRDLKPDNVFIETDVAGTERVKVLDFGVAKLVQDGIVAGTTETGTIVGTPCYMAPEQALGEKRVDARADVWALGVMLYECLAGVRPVQGDSVGQVVLKVTTEGIHPLSSAARELPNEVSDLVARMLEREPERRPALQEVLNVLASYTRCVRPSRPWMFTRRPNTRARGRALLPVTRHPGAPPPSRSHARRAGSRRCSCSA
jgi:eukaryotic-like serine/threonine-protein kinase